jgi:ATP-dependent Clp protease protease subunit
MRGVEGLTPGYSNDHLDVWADTNYSMSNNFDSVFGVTNSISPSLTLLQALNTGGGVREGINLYNVLKGMPFELITHNTGEVNSIGNAIFLAGSKRYATSISTFMFHSIGYTLQQGQRLEEKDVREKLDGILREQERIGGIISQNTNISPEEVSSLFKEAQTKDASFALEKGIIHEIRDVQITKGSPIISLVFKR